MTRLEIISHLCEMVAELEEMKQNDCLHDSFKLEIGKIGNKIQVLLHHMQEGGEK